MNDFQRLIFRVPADRFSLAVTTLLVVTGSFALAAGCNVPSLAPTAEQTTSGQATSEQVTAISSERFDEIVHQDKLVLVKFGATWCGPCRDVDKEIASLNADLPADVEVLKIDVDESPELAAEFQIQSIPRMLLVRKGEVLADEVGYMSKRQLQSWIGQHRVSEVRANPLAD